MDEEPTASDGLHGLRAGSRFGNYRLKRLLGKGGFGHVWEAEDTVMDRIVALKLLRSDYSENEKFRQRLFREARAAGRLHEPHVVPIHQCGEIDGQLYIDMRLIDGTDLEAVLSQEGTLAPARAVAVVRQIAAALNAAHAAGLIHRDVKPANILLGADDFACLVDFGLANAALDAKLTSTGFTVGTFAYMAPERLSAGGEIDRRVDVYALACVLYECLTGSQPYSGDIPALISAHITAPIPRPTEHRPGIPATFDDVIARGMAKSAGDRYATIIELADAARDAITVPIPRPTPSPPTLPATEQAPHPPTQRAGNRVTAKPVPPPQPIRPTPTRAGGISRRTAIALIVGAVALVAVIALAIGIPALVKQRPSESSPTSSSPPTPSTTMLTTTPPASAENLPTAGQLSSLCTMATDPGVSYTTKTNLVENGISSDEGHVIDHNLRNAYRNGNFPEYLNATNIQPAGPNAATADVAISGPKFAPPVTKNLLFLDQGGYSILQHDAALALLQAATATG